MDAAAEPPKPPLPEPAGSEPDDARSTPPPAPLPPPPPAPAPAPVVPAPAAEAAAAPPASVSAAVSPPPAPAPAEANGNSDRKKKRKAEDGEGCKSCSCKKSKCLKLYCVCFASGTHCSESCGCEPCLNKPMQGAPRTAPVLPLKPVQTLETGQDSMEQIIRSPMDLIRRKCTCKKSGCLKKYCDCFQGGAGCSINCKCEDCRNPFGRKDLTISQECTDLEGMNLDESGPDKMDSSHSGIDLHENQLSEQNKDDPAAYIGDYMITDQSCGDMLTLGLAFGTETQSLNDTQKAENAYPGKSLLNEESSDCYTQNSAHEPHHYWTGAVEGAAVNYTPQALPGALQSQLMPCNKLNEPRDYMPTEQNALSQHLRGMRRRSLFNEKAGASNKGVDKASDRHSANATTPKCKTISGDINSKPLRTPPCALPGIGLHLNALAAIPKEKIVSRDITIDESSNLPCPDGSSPLPYEQNIINDDFAQTTDIVSAEPSQGSPKKKRHKFDNGDGTSCKRCSCKKSKCLKLYCECFAAGVYCSEPCTCQGCLNNESNTETVLSTRQQIESRNPLAFAPKVIHSSESGLELGDFNNKTPASARHKRGCNCKKSSCLKKYCECFQGGVGCSISCRCEGCKNAFGRREGVAALSIEEPKQASEENNACVKEEKCEIDKQLVTCQATDVAAAENLLTTPSMLECRPLACLPPPSSKKPSSKKPRSSVKSGNPSRLCNSQAPLKTDILLAQFGNYAEMVLGDSTTDTLKGNSSPQTSVKVVSPNKKRVSPPRMGTGLSPICKSGRKLILKSIPSFPSLGGDLNNEDSKSKTPAP